MDPSLAPSDRQHRRVARRLGWAGGLLGFASGGFFDGIVLHQVLQWHHLLSGVKTDALRDIGTQVLVDGIFHAAMYLLAGMGLWLLFGARGEFARSGADRRLLAALLIGFGAWHVVDSVLSHWLLGLHRIRMDVPNPLAWDIGWLVLFGLPPLLAGLVLQRRAGDPAGAPPGPPTGDGRAGTPLLVAATVVAAGLLAGGAQPADASSRTTTIVLRPDVAPAQFLAALADRDFGIVWSSPDGRVWMLRTGDRASVWSLYRHGALYVGGSLLPAGCSSWLVV